MLQRMRTYVRYISVFSLIVIASGLKALDADSSSHDEVIDEIRVTIYDPKGKEVILTSDIKPGLDGSQRSLHDVLLDRLKVLDARNLGIEVTENEADQFLARIQQEHGMTREDLEGVFAELGYTFEEGRHMLRDQQMIERIVDHRVKSDRRMLIKRADVVAYDEAHPLYIPGEYTLQQGIIPYRERTHEEIQEYIDAGTVDDITDWEDTFTLAESDLAADKRFIDAASINTIVDVDVASDESGVEITRLVAKQQRRRVPVEERYEEIAQTLRWLRYEEVLSEYHNRLLHDAVVRFTYDNELEDIIGQT